MTTMLVCLTLGLTPCPIKQYPMCSIEPLPVFILDDAHQMCLIKEVSYEYKI